MAGMTNKTGQLSRPGDMDKLKNVWMPLWLLAGGVVVQMGAAIYKSGSFSDAVTEIALHVGVSTVIMLIAVLIAAKFRGIDLGPFGSAVLKLAAVSVVPGAVMVFIGPMLGLVPLIGGLLMIVAQFVLFFAMLGAMFDLDESDTWYCLCVIFITFVAVYLVLVGPRLPWSGR